MWLLVHIPKPNILKIAKFLGEITAKEIMSVDHTYIHSVGQKYVYSCVCMRNTVLILIY